MGAAIHDILCYAAKFYVHREYSLGWNVHQTEARIRLTYFQYC